jgi:CheY-like chemotaxis protein
MILIVDDQKYIGYALERLLHHTGHEAVALTGGAEAIAFMQVHRPDLVVLDLNMPDMDGFDVLREIRSRPEMKDVPVVMYSADNSHDHLDEARRLGAIDFLDKSNIGFDKLIGRISELAHEPPARH